MDLNTQTKTQRRRAKRNASLMADYNSLKRCAKSKTGLKQALADRYHISLKQVYNIINQHYGE